MEITGATAPFSRGIKNYHRRRQYERIDDIAKKAKPIRLGGKRKRSWKIKVLPKLKLVLKVVSPIKLLAKLRDAYIDMMLGVAGKVGPLDGVNFFGSKRIPKAREVRKSVSKTEEFETKLIFEIYKRLKASRELSSPSRSHML